MDTFNEMMSTRGSKLSAALCLVLAAACIFVLRGTFMTTREAEPIYPGPGVTDMFMLSDYFDGIKDTAGDTEVYVLDSGKPGASMLVLGGTHPNEPSGYVTAILLIENCVPETGVLYVIPRTNNSAFTCTDPQEGSPMRFTIDTPSGQRWFRFGSRATNPINQWPDPEIYVHASSGSKLSGSETRNINRTYPGRPNGTFTEKVSYAVTEMIRARQIDITVDLHEAAPEYPTNNAIVAHERSMTIGSMALMNMQMEGMAVSLEPSPPTLHGLTHRELGDYTDTLALLMETPNPSQGRLRGRTNADLVVNGRDTFYEMAASYGRLYVPWGPEGHPLVNRVARHVTGIVQIAEAYNEFDGAVVGKSIQLTGLPGYAELNEKGLGVYLQPK